MFRGAIINGSTWMMSYNRCIFAEILWVKMKISYNIWPNICQVYKKGGGDATVPAENKEEATKYQELIWRNSHTVHHLITCDNKSFYESHVSLSVGVGFVVGYSNICMCLADILVFLFISRNLLISVNLSKYIFGSSFLLEKIPISLRSPFWQI